MKLSLVIGFQHTAERFPLVFMKIHHGEIINAEVK